MSVGVRVVLLVLDGVGPDVVSPDLTPTLWRLATNGGHAPARGRAPLPSSTYPSIATLLTGAGPRDHGILTTARRDGVLPRWAGSATVRIRTVFDALRVAGVRSGFIVGDHKLVPLLRPAADIVWPAHGELPCDTSLDGHGYPTNAMVLPRILNACLDPKLGFLFGHLNEADTVGHDHGPSDPAAIAAYRATDAAIGAIVEALEPAWERTVLIVVSDHGMEARTAMAPIDIPRGGLVTDVLADGGSALVLARLDPDAVSASLIGSGLAATCTTIGPGVALATAPPKRIYASARLPAGGFHGGRATVPTLAIVGGGHPAVSTIARRIAAAAPEQSDWAPTIAAILAVRQPDATGIDLARRMEGVSV